MTIDRLTNIRETVMLIGMMLAIGLVCLVWGYNSAAIYGDNLPGADWEQFAERDT